ncbi:MAG TPA: glycosyltransferase [Anaerolineales bacterium]|nr:glycosyltransferase [Anaerolineales bacterium]
MPPHPLSPFLQLYAVLTGIILCALLLNTLINTLWGLRLEKSTTLPIHALPKISLLIPFRNEAAIIAETIANLQNLEYANLEILLLDDQSDDESLALAMSASQPDRQIRILQGETLPAGWLGKNWACWQLASQASGDYLLFSDADVRWQCQAIGQILALSQGTRADLLSIYPTQICKSWAERLTVPLIGQALSAYLPVVIGAHHLPFASMSAAIGQCMFFRRQAYFQVGGHAAVKKQVIEDIALARRIKQAGLRLRLAQAQGWLTCRMYDGWASVHKGFAKNMLAGHGGIFPLLLSTLFHWGVFLVPWVWLMVGGGWQALGLVLAGVLTRAISAYASQQRVWDAWTLPISVLIFSRIALTSFIWHLKGSGEWKGRILSN